MSIESEMLTNHLIFCCPLPLLSIFPSVRIFSSESVLCIRWPKHWSFSNSPSNENSGFRIDWFHLLEVWGTLKSFLQHHSSKASIFPCSAFFMVQLSHPYMTTGEAVALTVQTFVGKVISLLFNMLSNFVIAFLPKSKRLLISWLQSPSVGVFEPKKIKSVIISTFSPSICHEVMEPDAMIIVFWMMSFMAAVSLYSFTLIKETPGSSTGKESTCNAGDPGSIPGLGRCTGEGNGYPFQSSGLENSKGRRNLAGYTVHGVVENWNPLSDFHFQLVSLHFLPLEWYHLCIWGCRYFFQQSCFHLTIHLAQHFTWCTLYRS